MKVFMLTLLCALACAGCDSGHCAVLSSRDCTVIVSPLQRLACFDSQLGTVPMDVPMIPVQPLAESEPALQVVPIKALVKSNEAQRNPEEAGVRLMRSADALPGQSKVVISAPALEGEEPRPVLAISCLSNISRLQLLTARPLEINHAHLRLLLDGRPITDSRPWLVVEDGSVTDAGRGLAAIELLRHFTRPAQRLLVESDHAPFDGLAFDVSRLHVLMLQQREACHW